MHVNGKAALKGRGLRATAEQAAEDADGRGLTDWLLLVAEPRRGDGTRSISKHRKRSSIGADGRIAGTTR
jgi:hypothetical protein